MNYRAISRGKSQIHSGRLVELFSTGETVSTGETCLTLGWQATPVQWKTDLVSEEMTPESCREFKVFSLYFNPLKPRVE